MIVIRRFLVLLLHLLRCKQFWTLEYSRQAGAANREAGLTDEFYWVSQAEDMGVTPAAYFFL